MVERRGRGAGRRLKGLAAACALVAVLLPGPTVAGASDTPFDCGGPSSARQSLLSPCPGTPIGLTAEDPTVEPTAQPTVEPTVQPTVEPTVQPTAEPTPTNSALSSVSPALTSDASSEPSTSPPAVAVLVQPPSNPAPAGAVGSAYVFSYAGTAVGLMQRMPKRVGRSGRLRLGRIGPAQCPAGCSVRIFIASAGRKVAKAKLLVSAGRRTAIRLRLYSRARRALRRHHRLRATVFLAIVDGNRFHTVTLYKRIAFKGLKRHKRHKRH